MLAPRRTDVGLDAQGLDRHSTDRHETLIPRTAIAGIRRYRTALGRVPWTGGPITDIFGAIFMGLLIRVTFLATE